MPHVWHFTIVVTGGLLAAILPSATLAQQDPAAVFQVQCAACHTLSGKASPRIGPPLNEIYGRRAGTQPSFRYSNALSKSDIVWDDASLDAWLASPQSVVPGTTMVYRVPNPAARKLLIEFLKRQQ
ncbi:MAG: c-type cytochrome [Proteobacteria bacterium]|nr:c-type cytochrome [Pseudomonadota bacterium]